MKKIVLLIIAFIIGISVTGCVGSSHNLSDDEIIERIQTKMKKEFDKLNFTVDFNQYEFNVKVLQSFGEVGEVTVKDKRYNYDPVVVYDGTFGNKDENTGLNQEKIGIDPIIFVYHGYLNYLDEMSKETHQFVQDYLNKRTISFRKMGFRRVNFADDTVYPFSLEIIDGTVKRGDSDKNEILLWESPEMSITDYLNYYANKNALNFDYQAYDTAVSKGVKYSYVVTNQNNYLELEREINQIRPQKKVYIQLNNE